MPRRVEAKLKLWIGREEERKLASPVTTNSSYAHVFFRGEGGGYFFRAVKTKKKEEEADAP